VPNLTELAIRPLRSEDAAAAHELAKNSPLAAQWSVLSYERLDEMEARGWIAESAGTTTGFLIVRIVPPEAEILNIVVAPMRRRKGIAAALLTLAEIEMTRANVTDAFLEVRESNIGAIAFYEKRGFSRAGLRPLYYRDPIEAAVLMKKKLTG